MPSRHADLTPPPSRKASRTNTKAEAYRERCAWWAQRAEADAVGII